MKIKDFYWKNHDFPQTSTPYSTATRLDTKSFDPRYIWTDFWQRINRNQIWFLLILQTAKPSA